MPLSHRILGQLADVSAEADAVFGRPRDPGPAGAWRHYGRRGREYALTAVLTLVLAVFYPPPFAPIGSTAQGFLLTLCLVVLLTVPWARLHWLAHLARTVHTPYEESR